MQQTHSYDSSNAVKFWSTDFDSTTHQHLPQAYVGTVDVRHILVGGMSFPQDKLISADPAILRTVPLSSA